MWPQTAAPSGGEQALTAPLLVSGFRPQFRSWNVGTIDINRTYLGVSQNAQMVAEEGACDAPFESELKTLGVPTLASVDPKILAALDCVALNGVGACDDE